MSRLKTGPVRVSGDWAGVFIRGDNAIMMAIAVERGARALMASDPLMAMKLKRLATDLRSCAEPCEAVEIALVDER